VPLEVLHPWDLKHLYPTSLIQCPQTKCVLHIELEKRGRREGREGGIDIEATYRFPN